MVENRLSRILLYIDEEGAVSMDVVVDYENETFWATQKSMAELFGVSGSNIHNHIRNVFKTGEADRKSCMRKIQNSPDEGNREFNLNTLFYNLDVIIAVSYRIKSKSAMRFRKWITGALKEFIVKGFVLDDDLLKNGNRFGKEYFDHLLEMIQDIRESERQFFEKITDLYATSFDYNKNAEITNDFYLNVLNKLQYAINVENESEIYLSEDELAEINRVVEFYIDFAELQAKSEIPMFMDDWASQLNGFLDFLDYQITDGKISSAEISEFIGYELEKIEPISDDFNEHVYSEFEQKTNKLLNK